MRCTYVRRHLVSYVLDRLPSRRQQAVAAHVRHCATCSAEAAASRMVWDLLDALPDGGSAPDVTREVLARIAEPRGWRRLQWDAPTWRVAATACALALCYCLGFGVAGRLPAAVPGATTDELTQALAFFQEVPPASLADAYLNLEPESQGGLP